jgi:antitoxin CptB
MLYLNFFKVWVLMTADIQKAKLAWRSRRGMLELDLLLGRFLSDFYDQLKEEQLVVYERILHEPDPDLYAWLMGYAIPEDKAFQDFVAWFRAQVCHAR